MKFIKTATENSWLPLELPFETQSICNPAQDFKMELSIDLNY
jgi:hypothetical protein